MGYMESHVNWHGKLLKHRESCEVSFLGQVRCPWFEIHNLPSSFVVQDGEKQHPVCTPDIHKILWKWPVCINTVLFGFTSSAFLFIWIVIFPSPCYSTHIWPLEPQHLDLGIWWLLWVPSSSGHWDSVAASHAQSPNSDLFPGPRELFRAILRSAHVPPLSHTLWPRQGATELKTKVNILSFASAMTP